MSNKKWGGIVPMNHLFRLIKILQYVGSLHLFNFMKYLKRSL